MRTSSYNFNPINGNLIRSYNYDEHFLPSNLKNQFNYIIYKLNSDNHYKESYNYLMRDRINPHDWIEFYNVCGNIYVVAYYYLGGYVVKVVDGNREKNSFDNYPAIGKLINQFNWYERYYKIHRMQNIEKYLFSVSEVPKIISDISRLNHLSILK